jgi:hypothetical protein
MLVRDAHLIGIAKRRDSNFSGRSVFERSRCASGGTGREAGAGQPRRAMLRIAAVGRPEQFGSGIV